MRADPLLPREARDHREASGGQRAGRRALRAAESTHAPAEASAQVQDESSGGADYTYGEIDVFHVVVPGQLVTGP